MIHWPVALVRDKFLATPKEFEVDLVSIMETWQAMEDLVDEGLIKSLGVSNFNAEQIVDIMCWARHPLCVNQIELTPYLTRSSMIDFCQRMNIVVTAYSPLGSGDRPDVVKKGTEPLQTLLANDTVNDIAKSFQPNQVTAAQVLIRFHIQRGVSVIPKSVNKDRIDANFNVFHFTLSPEQMDALLDLNQNFHYV